MKQSDISFKEHRTYEDQLPYERFLKSGPESLTDAELLAIIIRTGSCMASPVDIAKKVMANGY